MIVDHRLILDPLIPWALIAAYGAIGLILCGALLIRGARGAWLRALALLALGVALANPVLVREQKAPVPSVAAMVIDTSPSNRIGDRQDQTRQAAERVRELAAELDGLTLREVTIDGASDGHEGETRMFGALESALADIPVERRAGAILITDGQVHDVPDPEQLEARGFGPVHALLAGARDQRDRRLEAVQVPSFGLVDGEVTARVRILDDAASGEMAGLTVARDGEVILQRTVTIGSTVDLRLDLPHGGQNVFEVTTPAVPGEFSDANNRTAFMVEAVRDRLRVLLVSGQPHNGERTWRNILKSDPSVDLVHFTILRPPDKQDATPIDELSLIAFPVRELFELKLHEFDLVIFDRYKRHGVLPPIYFDNIARYVAEGGALLEASGPHFASPNSLYFTGLGNVLPGRPTGRLIDQPFVPAVTDLGARHPVTARLPGAGERGGAGSNWGRWFRLIDLTPDPEGMVAMTGPDNRPLLVMQRIGEGRVAQMGSDQIWLWSRGHDGGGPQAELLRRLVHWLMKEPELEEDRLVARVEGRQLRIERRSLREDLSPVEITAPNGETLRVEMEPSETGWATATIETDALGVYRLSDESRTAFAVMGTLNPRELEDLRASDDRLMPVIEASGGGRIWLDERPEFDLREVGPARAASGPGWLGLRRTEAALTVGIDHVPLAPALLALVLLMGLIGLAWWREGHAGAGREA